MVKRKILSTKIFHFKRQREKRGVSTAHRVKFRVYNVVVAKIKGHALCVKWDAGEKDSKGRLESSAPAHTDLKQKLKSEFFKGRDARETGLVVYRFSILASQRWIDSEIHHSVSYLKYIIIFNKFLLPGDKSQDKITGLSIDTDSGWWRLGWEEAIGYM